MFGIAILCTNGSTAKWIQNGACIRTIKSWCCRSNLGWGNTAKGPIPMPVLVIRRHSSHWACKRYDVRPTLYIYAVYMYMYVCSIYTMYINICTRKCEYKFLVFLSNKFHCLRELSYVASCRPLMTAMAFTRWTYETCVPLCSLVILHSICRSWLPPMHVMTQVPDGYIGPHGRKIEHA